MDKRTENRKQSVRATASVIAEPMAAPAAGAEAAEPAAAAFPAIDGCADSYVPAVVQRRLPAVAAWPSLEFSLKAGYGLQPEG